MTVCMKWVHCTVGITPSSFSITGFLTNAVFTHCKDVEPIAILDERVAKRGVGREFLVRWRPEDLSEEGTVREDDWVGWTRHLLFAVPAQGTA